jgi:hypothetical protein
MDHSGKLPNTLSELHKKCFMLKWIAQKMFHAKKWIAKKMFMLKWITEKTFDVKVNFWQWLLFGPFNWLTKDHWVTFSLMHEIKNGLEISDCQTL